MDNAGNLQPQFRDYTAVAQLTDGGFTRVDNACDVDLALSGGVTDLNSTPSLTRDAWMRFIGNGNEITLTYQNKEADSNPAMVVYTAIAGPGPVDCSFGLNGAGNVLNQLGCADGANAGASGIQTETISFQSEAGRIYLLRILDMGTDAVNNGMTGILCISDGSQDYNDCAEARELTVGQCSVPINVINEVNTCSMDTEADMIATNCLDGAPAPIIPAFSANWRYEDDLTSAAPADQGALNWTQEPYDDSNAQGWEGGTGAFGFSEANLTTALFDGDNNTYYFRHDFNVPAANTYSSLTVNIRRDDGAVIYINGVEVARERMPTGVITHSTNAISCIWGSQVSNYFPIEIPVTAGLLNAGNNVIAVEVHNCSADNRDIVFDLSLDGTLSGGVTCSGSESDAWAQFTVPYQCDPEVDPATATLTYTGTGPFTADCGDPNRFVARPGANGIFDPADTGADADFCDCSNNSIKELPDTRISVQYDNRNFTLDDAADVAMSIFRADGCPQITVLNNPLVGCTDVIESGDEGVEEITIEGVTFGETYFVRLVNLEPPLTSLGKICVLWGETLAQRQCPPENDYGALDGEFKDFAVKGEWNDENSIPSNVIPDTNPLSTEVVDLPPCVLPGGSNPSSNTPNPIRSQGWMRFTVPTDFATEENTNAVTVQFDNEGFTSGNPQNAAIAVYVMPGHPDGNGNCAAFNDTNPFLEASPSDPNTSGLQILGCINAVFEGTESLTIPVADTNIDVNYFVRIMNVNSGSGSTADMPGRIRVFPFAPCTVGENSSE